MEKIDVALQEFREMDELSARSSLIHVLNPLAKLLTTIFYILTVVSFGKYELDCLLIMFLYPYLLFELSGTSFKGFFVKLRFVLLLVCAVGVVNPFLDRTVVLHLGAFTVTGGMVSMITLMLKGVYSLMASYILVATTKFDAIAASLRKLHMPAIMVSMMLLTYRYISVMMDELSVMTTAYKLRAPGQKGVHVSAWGSFMGQLLLRSMDRAEELYAAMRLRGYDGEYLYVEDAGFKTADVLFIILSVGVSLLFRFVNILALIGSLVYRG